MDSNIDLFRALDMRDVRMVETLLEHPHTDVNKTNEYGFTVLEFAWFEGQLNIARLLLADERTDIKRAYKHGWTPFYGACINGDANTVTKMLADQNLRIDQVNYDGRMPLLWVFLGPHKNANLLINKPNRAGMTPFFVACEYGHVEVVKVLIQNPSVDVNKPDKDGITPLSSACSRGDIEIVKLLLKNPRINSSQPNFNYDLLSRAFFSGNTDLVKFLLLRDPEFDPNKPKSMGVFSIFMHACRNGHVEMVKFLLEDLRIDPNKPSPRSFGKPSAHASVTLLDMARERAHILGGIVELLEAYEAPKPDYTKMTRKELAQSLLRESAEGHLDEVKSIMRVFKEKNGPQQKNR